MLNIERYRKELENYNTSLDCDIHKIRENNEGIRNHLCISKTCPECRKENIEWLLSEYEEPILTEKEKTYLKAVMEPFKDRVNVIKKYSDTLDGTLEYIVFVIDDLTRSIDLPDFESGTKYKGMKLGRRYTPEELGL